jgi:hypothetical protein
MVGLDVESKFISISHTTFTTSKGWTTFLIVWKNMQMLQTKLQTNFN